MSKKNKQRKVKLLINPGAGEPAQTAKNTELAARTLQELGLDVSVALGRGPKEIVSLVKKAIRDDFETLVIMGGDGTIESALRTVMSFPGRVRQKIHIGILSSGTYNNVARSIGIPEDIPEACQLIAKDTWRKMDVGKARIKHKKPFYFFELTAIGLTAALYPASEKIKDGKWQSIKEAFTTFIQHEPHPQVTLRLEGESKIKLDTLLVVVSNTPAYGMNFLVAPQASLVDGLLDITAFPSFTKAQLMAYHAQMMNEGKTENENVQRYRAHEVKIKSSPPMDIMADGQMLGRTPIRISIYPGGLKIIAPEDPSAGLAAPITASEAEEEIPVPLPVGEEAEKPVPVH